MTVEWIWCVANDRHRRQIMNTSQWMRRCYVIANVCIIRDNRLSHRSILRTRLLLWWIYHRRCLMCWCLIHMACGGWICCRCTNEKNNTFLPWNVKLQIVPHRLYCWLGLPSFAVCSDALCLATAENAGADGRITLFIGIGWSRAVFVLMPCKWLSSRLTADVFWAVSIPIAVVLAIELFVAVDIIAPDERFCVMFAIAGDAFSEWFLLGVEHTAILFCAGTLFVDVIELIELIELIKLRSGLLALIAVGFTGWSDES